MKGEFLMSVVSKPVNLGLLSRSFCVVCSVPRPFWLPWPVRSVPHSLSPADLLSCRHQFLCGFIRLIRTCGSFQETEALGVVAGIEASSQDLSALYPAAWNTSQGQPGGLSWEGHQKPPACFHLHFHHSYQGRSTTWSWQCGYKQIKHAPWQTFGEL